MTKNEARLSVRVEAIAIVRNEYVQAVRGALKSTGHMQIDDEWSAIIAVEATELVENDGFIPVTNKINL